MKISCRPFFERVNIRDVLGGIVSGPKRSGAVPDPLVHRGVGPYWFASLLLHFKGGHDLWIFPRSHSKTS